MKKFLLVFFFCGWSGLALAGISMQLESSKIQEGESFKLGLTLDGEQTDRVPDLTPLQENFEIIGTERSTSYTVINGQAHSSSQWTVLLTPKKTGMLIIPSLQVGQEKTNPEKIEVTADVLSGNKAGSPKQQEVILLTEVNELNPYLNQQVILTVKLFHSRRLMDADYQPPKFEDGLLIPLGPGAEYQTVKDSRLYTVEEQQYAFFPQKSGSTKITSPVFRALIYDDHALPRRINEGAEAITLKVKSIPLPARGKTWLPAKQVILREKYDTDALNLDEGGTLVRTVTLQATALPAQLLPNLDFTNTQDEFSVYPEKPMQRNNLSQGNLLGSSSIKVTYLLNKSGDITIPALQIPWFNTVTGREEIATLPERRIKVRPTLSASPTSSTTKSILSTKTVANPLPSAKVSAAITSGQRFSVSNNLAWVLVAVFFFAWLFTVVLWFLQKTKSGPAQTKKKALKQVKDACAQSSPHAARDALLQWAHCRWPQASILNLAQIAERISHNSLQQEIDRLSQALYHDAYPKSWHGEALWQALLAYKSEDPHEKKANTSLPQMHKL
jgi:hypothetical protein